MEPGDEAMVVLCMCMFARFRFDSLGSKYS